MSRISRYARLRPSPAAVIAVVALVFALSGVAVALPGKNSVVSKDIKKNAVTAAKIKNGAVTEPKLGDGAVGTSKLGSDAVTGAKVNEATLGKVPSAETATKAVTADAATKATTADNALELEGRTLAQVRPILVGVKDDDLQGLDDTAFESVAGVTITNPAGGADVLVTATVELDNNGGQAGGACRLRYNSGLVGNTIHVTLAAGYDVSVALSAFVNSSGAGSRQAVVECQGSIADDQVQFVSGDLAIQAFPIGA